MVKDGVSDESNDILLDRVQAPQKKLRAQKPPSKALPLHKDELTIYTDAGCSSKPKQHAQKGSCHYAGVEWFEEDNEFKIVFEKRPRKKPHHAVNNAQMEMRGVTEALELSVGNFSERKIRIRTDFQGAEKAAREYLATYPQGLRDLPLDEQEFYRARRKSLTKKYIEGASEVSGLKKEYEHLFDLLDYVAFKGCDITIECCGRLSDKWATHVDHMAAQRADGYSHQRQQGRKVS